MISEGRVRGTGFTLLAPLWEENNGSHIPGHWVDRFVFGNKAIDRLSPVVRER